jgi:prepilin-type N-terminal cleavage/methylation domain-containing protein
MAEAFTLVELLVVIAIVAILAALLFPLVGSIRRSASSAISVSNLRNIGTAIVTYAADNNGTLPDPALSHHNNKLSQFGSTGQLGWILRNYLPIVTQVSQPVNPNPYYSPTFDYPAARTGGQTPSSLAMRTYTVYVRVTDSIGDFRPLGYWGGSNPPPMTTAGLAARDTRGKPWITEATPINPPPHGNYRNTLMHDYSVKAIPTNEFIPPSI